MERQIIKRTITADKSGKVISSRVDFPDTLQVEPRASHDMTDAELAQGHRKMPLIEQPPAPKRPKP